jgi:2-polyprenyl-6-methoxyphenol hydroxylase-like FAD-dependent oxidoreductase
MLARLLHRSDIPSTVFEGDTSPNYRSQGGSLDLHETTGLAAFKEACLYDEFLRSARWDGEAMIITDKDLKVYVQKKGTTGDGQRNGSATAAALGGQRPEIDRAELRRILTESLPDGCVRWGKHLKRIDEADGTLHFADGTSESGFDLVVGADGAWSKVRAVLSEQKPIFSGIANHWLLIPDAKRTAPEVYAVVNRGSVFALADGRRIALQYLGDGSINVYISTVVDNDRWTETCGYDTDNFEQTRDHYIGKGGAFADWHPTLREAVSKADATCHAKGLFQLPVGYRWGHRDGFTLIGDAAHLMTPFGGEGVNMALQDARELAKHIRDAVVNAQSQQAEPGSEQPLSPRDILGRAAAAYEEEMWPRAEKVARATDERKNVWFYSENVPRSVIAKVASSQVEGHVPWFLRPLAKAVVHAYFGGKMALGYF